MNYRDTNMKAESQLVLSIFSGIDLLGKGFIENGFTVVSAGDLMFGQDIRKFRSIEGKFDGIIGGSPCQDFSKARRIKPTGYGLEMLSEFKRIVIESKPKWFLLENVPQIPDIHILNYQVQRFSLSPTDLGYEQNRPRHFQFGSLEGFVLDIKKTKFEGKKKPCLTASEGKKVDRRSFGEFLELQGLDRNFELEGFTKAQKYKLIGNGVHLGVSKEISKLICECAALNNERRLTDTNICVCGCGQIVEGKAKHFSPNCRKRMQKKRESAFINAPGLITV